jgi:hypothetical protein
MSERAFRVVIVGATGVFGSRLVERLAPVDNISIVFVTRNGARAEMLAAAVRTRYPTADITTLAKDRNEIDSQTLRSLAARVVIDAAGPFQVTGYKLVGAAIEARCHYIDFSDSREFVAGISVFDARAREAGVAVISGASSTPALSHAAIDQLTKGWRRIDTLRVAISPGNRAPRGLAVMQSILSWAGRPVRVFADGGWSERPGWGKSRRLEFPGLGVRLVSISETSDLDLLVARYKPTISAEFFAGLELALLHRGLVALGLLVRWRLVSSLRPVARVARWIAALFYPFGTDRGGMLAEAKGINSAGEPVRAVWSLIAESGVGPAVPSLPAAALVRKLKCGELIFCGAAASVGFLNLSDFQLDFEALGLKTMETERRLEEPSLFRRVLGDAFDDLPRTTRLVHSPAPAIRLEGRVEVGGATTWVGSLVAAVFGFPAGSEEVPLRVAIEEDGAAEKWARVYPSRTMRSVMGAADGASRTVEERFGLITIRLRVASNKTGLSLIPLSARLGPISLPKVFVPTATAIETVDAEERHVFDVEIRAPLIGRLVRYQGWLAPSGPWKITCPGGSTNLEAAAERGKTGASPVITSVNRIGLAS